MADMQLSLPSPASVGFFSILPASPQAQAFGPAFGYLQLRFGFTLCFCLQPALSAFAAFTRFR
jgi:hypothetical protein